MTIRLLIVDDHTVVREGLRALFELQPDLEVAGEAGDAASAIALARSVNFDLAVLDLMLPDRDGVALAGELRAIRPETRVLLLTSTTQHDRVHEAVQQGVSSYLLKDVAADQLIDAVRRTAAGESVLHPRVAANLVRSVREGADGSGPLRDLSEREREVLILIAQGLSNQQIATRLGIGDKTVKTHVGNVLAKLQLDDRTQAAVYAWRNRLVGM